MQLVRLKGPRPAQRFDVVMKGCFVTGYIAVRRVVCSDTGWNAVSQHSKHDSDPSVLLAIRLNEIRYTTLGWFQKEFLDITYDAYFFKRVSLCNWLTESMEHSLSLDASIHSSSQKIPHHLWNLKVHFRVHKSPLLIHILSQIHPVHNFSTPFLKILYNITLPSTSSFASDLFPSGFPTKIFYAFLSHTYYVSLPSYPSWFDGSYNICISIERVSDILRIVNIFVCSVPTNVAFIYMEFVGPNLKISFGHAFTS